MTKKCSKSHPKFPPISTPFFALLGSFFPMGLIGRSILILDTFCHFLLFFRSIYPNLAPSPPKNAFLPYFAPTKMSLFAIFSTFFIFSHPDPPSPPFFIFESPIPNNRIAKIKKWQKSKMYRYLDPKKIKSGDFRKKNWKKWKK